MVAINECAAIILASGFSRRFGAQNKLLAPFRERPLADYAAALAQALPFKEVFAVTPAPSDELADVFARRGATIIHNHSPAMGQGASLALGVEAAMQTHATAACILLADMPFIMSADIEALAQALPDKGAAITHDGKRRMPPALFHHGVFPDLVRCRGDQGARSIFDGIDVIIDVAIDPQRLADIDRKDDLMRLAKSGR